MRRDGDGRGQRTCSARRRHGLVTGVVQLVLLHRGRAALALHEARGRARCSRDKSPRVRRSGADARAAGRRGAADAVAPRAAHEARGQPALPGDHGAAPVQLPHARHVLEENVQRQAYMYVPGPPYCTYRLHVPAVCVPYVPEAQGSLPRGPTHCTYAVRVPASSVPSYRVPWHPRFSVKPVARCKPCNRVHGGRGGPKYLAIPIDEERGQGLYECAECAHVWTSNKACRSLQQ